jgi:hypothetical protein
MKRNFKASVLEVNYWLLKNNPVGSTLYLLLYCSQPAIVITYTLYSLFNDEDNTFLDKIYLSKFPTSMSAQVQVVIYF